jgi:hypothetical protein
MDFLVNSAKKFEVPIPIMTGLTKFGLMDKVEGKKGVDMKVNLWETKRLLGMNMRPDVSVKLWPKTEVVAVGPTINTVSQPDSKFQLNCVVKATVFDWMWVMHPKVKELGWNAHEGGPLQLCEGDCDKDHHCAAGLKCLERSGSEEVPGCGGNPRNGWDYCTHPVVKELGWNAHQGGPLQLCEGDCDKDQHCATGLKCLERSGSERVPGCSGNPRNGWDFCVYPDAKDLGKDAHQDGPLGLCQGDCDKDHHCAAGLKCLERSGSERVPGCGGNPRIGWDFCVNPVP